jgi:hypothetical protein
MEDSAISEIRSHPAMLRRYETGFALPNYAGEPGTNGGGGTSAGAAGPIASAATANGVAPMAVENSGAPRGVLASRNVSPAGSTTTAPVRQKTPWFSAPWGDASQSQELPWWMRR